LWTGELKRKRKRKRGGAAARKVGDLRPDF
jgi:hypothetical protein